MNNAIEIKHKELSNGLATILVTLNGQEGMLLPELARVLGVSTKNLHRINRQHGFEIVTPGYHVLSTLKKEKVISLNAARVNFLPRETVEALVKIVNTPEAWTIYRELWEVAEAVHKGQLITAMQKVGVTHEDMLKYVNETKAELALLREQLDAVTKTVEEAAESPLAFALRRAIPAVEAIKLFPGLNAYAQTWFEQKFINNHRKLKQYHTDASRLTYFLKVVHKLEANIVAAEVLGDITKTDYKPTRVLYDFGALERLEQLYLTYRRKSK
jgi:hypothetical protein